MAHPLAGKPPPDNFVFDEELGWHLRVQRQTAFGQQNWVNVNWLSTGRVNPGEVRAARAVAPVGGGAVAGGSGGAGGAPAGGGGRHRSETTPSSQQGRTRPGDFIPSILTFRVSLGYFFFSLGGILLYCDITSRRRAGYGVLQSRVSTFITSEIQFNEVVL